MKDGLVKYLRESTFYHCEWNRRTNGVKFGVKDTKDLKLCWHSRSYEDVAKLPLFPNASDLPAYDVVYDSKRVKKQKRQHVEMWVTPTKRTYIHHMIMASGHSECGSHVFIPGFKKQVQRKLQVYNDKFHRHSNIQESCPVDGSLTEMKRVFHEHNLFVGWERFLNGGPSLSPYEWRMISLLYRRRTASELRKKAAKDKHTAEEEGDSREYEFVATYASLASLITSVKAWQGRRVTGWVQVGLDNMYNVLKSVPHVRSSPRSFAFSIDITPSTSFTFFCSFPNLLSLPRLPIPSCIF